jgi:hypothetical protein
MWYWCPTEGSIACHERRGYSNGMSYRRLSLALSAFLAVLSIHPGWAQGGPRPESFPLAKGSYWIYEGEREWQEHGPKVFKAKITQRMEVVDKIERDGVVAAVVRGYPTSGQDELQVLIVVNGLQFYLLPAEESVLKRLKDSNDELVDLVQEDQIELSLPLVKGKRFCEAEQMTRPDGYYCNVVEQKWSQRFAAVLGVSTRVEYNVYKIAFRTAPDHVLLNFAPGIGITSYQYVHHGTINREEMKLVEFHDRAASSH